MKKVILLSTSMLFVVMFTANMAMSQSSADYKAKIESLNKDMAKAMVDGNVEKGLSFYTDDAISMPSYAPIREGIAAIREASQEMSKDGTKYNTFELTTLKVIPNGNLITEVGTYKLNLSMQGMDKPVDDHGKYLTVWKNKKTDR